MANKKVVVLMSAYNGEKYIEEQIQSILTQTYKNLILYIRDDGSTDNTRVVLEKYQQEDRIKVFCGENKGFINSFLDLLCQCERGDYYAYADQDDIWLPQKIEYAVEELDKHNNEIPLLYFANYDFYNSSLEFEKHCRTNINGPSFHNALVDCIALGFNSVINEVARESITKNRPKDCCGHDWWSYMVCAALGEVYYDKRYTTKYRRHEDNVSSNSRSFIKFQIWRVKKFILNGYFAQIKKQLCEFEKIYGEKLKEEDLGVLKLFTTSKFNLGAMIKKVFYKHRFRQNLIDEIVIRVMFLFGRL